MNRSLKFATVAAASAASWWATSTLAQQFRQRPTYTTRAGAAATPGGPPDSCNWVPYDDVASSEFRGFSLATNADGTLTVTGTACLTDTRSNVNYIWQLRQLDDADNVLAVTWYDQRIFTVQGTFLANFADVIQPPPAGTWVQLSLYNYHPPADVTQVQDEDLLVGYLVYRAAKVTPP